MTYTDPRLQDPQLRAAKLQQTLDLMAACLDVLNEKITGNQLIEKIAVLATCASVECAWWHVGQPESMKCEVVGPPLQLPDGWAEVVEAAIVAADPSGPGLIEDLLPAGDEQSAQVRELVSGSVLMAYADLEPARVILVLGNRADQPEWQDYDRNKLRMLLPLIHKSISIKKQLSSLHDRVEFSNKVLDDIPRGLITLLPDGRILMANHMARLILQRGQHLKQQGDKLLICDPQLQQELCDQLDAIRLLSPDNFEDFAWHRNISGSVGVDSCMASLRAFALSTWRTESIASDRLAVMILQFADMQDVPPVEQIREYYQLTNAQARLIVVLLGGASLDEAATELHVSINTVRSHLRAIYARLGVDSKAQLLHKVGSTISNPVREQRL